MLQPFKTESGDWHVHVAIPNTPPLVGLRAMLQVYFSTHASALGFELANRVAREIGIWLRDWHDLTCVSYSFVDERCRFVCVSYVRARPWRVSLGNELFER